MSSVMSPWSNWLNFDLGDYFLQRVSLTTFSLFRDVLTIVSYVDVHAKDLDWFLWCLASNSDSWDFSSMTSRFSRKAFHSLLIQVSTYIHIQKDHIWRLCRYKLSAEREIWLDFIGFFRWVCLLFVMFCNNFCSTHFHITQKLYVVNLIIFYDVFDFLYCVTLCIKTSKKCWFVNCLLSFVLIVLISLFSSLLFPRVILNAFVTILQKCDSVVLFDFVVWMLQDGGALSTVYELGRCDDVAARDAAWRLDVQSLRVEYVGCNGGEG